MKGKYHIAYEDYHGVKRWLVRSVNPKDRSREQVKARRAFIITRTLDGALERIWSRAHRMRSL